MRRGGQNISKALQTPEEDEIGGRKRRKTLMSEGRKDHDCDRKSRRGPDRKRELVIHDYGTTEAKNNPRFEISDSKTKRQVPPVSRSHSFSSTKEDVYLSMDVWNSQYLAVFRDLGKPNPDTRWQRNDLENPFNQIGSVTILESEVNERYNNGSPELSREELLVDTSSVTRLLALQFLSFLAKISFYRSAAAAENHTNMLHSLAFKKSCHHLTRLFSCFPLSALEQACNCTSELFSPAHSFFDSFTVNCFICNSPGSPFTDNLPNPIILSLVGSGRSTSSKKADDGSTGTTTDECDLFLKPFGWLLQTCKHSASDGLQCEVTRGTPARSQCELMDYWMESYLKSYESSIFSPVSHPQVQEFLSPSQSSCSDHALLVGPFKVPSINLPDSPRANRGIWMHDYCFILKFCKTEADGILLPDSESFVKVGVNGGQDEIDSCGT